MLCNYLNGAVAPLAPCRPLLRPAVWRRAALKRDVGALRPNPSRRAGSGALRPPPRYESGSAAPRERPRGRRRTGPAAPSGAWLPEGDGALRGGAAEWASLVLSPPARPSRLSSAALLARGPGVREEQCRAARRARHRPLKGSGAHCSPGGAARHCLPSRRLRSRHAGREEVRAASGAARLP